MADEEENHALVADDVVPTEFALMAMSSSSSDNKVYDDSYCSKSCRKNTENLNTKISKLNEELSDCETDLYNYKRGLSQVEARLVEFKENEIKFYERIRVLERDVEVRDNKIEYLRNELEEVKKEKESIDHKLAGFGNASKDLGLPEFVDDTVTDYSRPTPSVDVSKGNSSGLEGKNYSIFEQGESSVNIMSKPMIKFMKETGCPNAIKVNNTENARKPTMKYAEMYMNTSKSPRVRGNQRNWNNLKSQQLGKDFLMQNKACYKCGYFDHLASNCGIWVDKGETWPRDSEDESEVDFTLNETVRSSFEQEKFDKFTKEGIPQDNIDDKGYWYSGCSRHMTGNISYLSEYEPYDGGYVSFGHGGGKITGKDVELHLYRSMIGSLMYLTASRPDIMFAVCACARHQVTPKECHLHAVK
ncbi:putative ribonuclease H-like domain-containing protein [Tanacetum coccineum]